jgi:hypothetical protein
MSAFAFTVGVGIVDEFGFVQRFQYLAQGMVYDTISKRSGADFTLFDVLNEEAAERAGTIRFILQFPLELKQFAFGVEFKGGNGGFVSFAFAGFMPGVV